LANDGQVSPEALEGLRKWSTGIIEGLQKAKVSVNTVRRSAAGSGPCKACGNPVRIQIFKGEEWCSDDCRKVILKEV
jgi:hypothetical protein